MSKGLENEIAYLRDIKMQFWVAFLGSFGGSVGVIVSDIPLILKIIMAIIGFTFSVVYLVNYLKKGVMIEKRINFLKKKGG
ncbi:MAG TPA: hypothetical protein DDW90_02155 [Cyanobacteria bacterium UBA9971]|nr:hypothetical protein [Cyanobacteria bacterium UBA9971]